MFTIKNSKSSSQNKGGLRINNSFSKVNILFLFKLLKELSFIFFLKLRILNFFLRKVKKITFQFQTTLCQV